MDKMNIEEMVKLQRRFFQTGTTRNVAYRKNCLKLLREGIQRMEPEIMAALKEDLGKSSSESYMTEVGMTLEELTFMEKNIHRLARKKYALTPFAQFCAESYEVPEPYGVVLIMSPWNYPFMLTMDPVIDAIAAGNTVLIKPSAYAPATSRVIQKLIQECFSAKLASVVTGGRDVNQDLLEQEFDYIFFTGGKTVGHLVLEKAAKHLTPVTLELGGKSPCIVDETANLKLAARRIVFGKYLNVGQTCVAPDYLLVQESVKEELAGYIKKAIISQFGQDALKNPNYGKIINEKHFNRLKGLLEGADIIYGGQNDGISRIEPTVVDNVTLKAPLMGEEIFGPILPILTFKDREDVVRIVRANPTPLATYMFTTNKENIAFFMKHIRFGGGCINDTIIHLATSRMGFGGTGSSGMGAYHGKKGFDTFTHYKSIVDKKNFIDLPFRYQPYQSWKDKLIRMFLK
ncbi:MAG: aldehyde dehydrogenase [Clostridia bacterium]|nr:aldehyde dehydrogenase [Clostridia bacterium]NCD03292.1 aldehyde dehydrogenase [Clostridia bacterium]